jgi:hypothetical protein
VRVEWAILARYAESVGGTATIVGAGIDTYYPPEVPAPIQVVLAFNLRGQQNEMEGDHELTIRILDAEMQQIGEEGTFGWHGEPNPLIAEGWEAGALFAPIVSQFVAEEEGTYSIEVLVDGDHMKLVPFRVVPGGPPT